MAADGIITTEATGQIESANLAAERMFGYRDAELTGKNLNALISFPGQEDRGFIALAERSADGPRGTMCEGQGHRKDGSVFPLEVTVSEIAVSDRQLYFALVRDITERKRLERRVLEIGTHEQQRIGQELHDGLGQELTGLSYLAKTLQRRLEERGTAEADTAGELVRGLQRTIGRVQDLAKGLVPAQVDAELVVPALHALAFDLEERYGVVCRVYAEAGVRVHSNHKAVHLYRIAQEAVRNAIRHGRARTITLRLSETATQAVLEVLDDGQGIRPGTHNGSGMGIKIMQYRARLIGGSLQVQPVEGGGTRVVCTVHQDDPHDEER